MVKRLLEDGERWLRSKLLEIDGVTAVYSRGGDSVTVNATKGTRQDVAGNEHGLILSSQMLDFLIERGELILNSVQIVPEPNDRIVVTENGKSEEYRVSNGKNSQDCFEFSDRNHELYRIHTSYLGSVT